MRLSVFINCLVATASLFLPVLNTESGITVSGFYLYRFTPIGFVILPTILAVFCSETGVLPEFLRKTIVFAVTFFGALGIIVAIIETKIILESTRETIACYGWNVTFLLLSLIKFIFAIKEPTHCENECTVYR